MDNEGITLKFNKRTQQKTSEADNVIPQFNVIFNSII